MFGVVILFAVIPFTQWQYIKKCTTAHHDDYSDDDEKALTHMPTQMESIDVSSGLNNEIPTIGLKRADKMEMIWMELILIQIKLTKKRLAKHTISFCAVSLSLLAFSLHSIFSFICNRFTTTFFLFYTIFLSFQRTHLSLHSFSLVWMFSLLFKP